MFGPSHGSWCLRSKLDPRWNTSGEGLVSVTGGVVKDARDFIDRKEVELGCKPPDDLEYSCMKD